MLAHASEAEQNAIADYTLAMLKEQKDPERAKGRNGSAAILRKIERLREARYVTVGFTAMDSDTWEKVVSTHPAPEGHDGGMDWKKALPTVAALCCEDESMQDDEAWTELLTGWSHGEQVSLWGALLNINTDHPAPHVPKG